MITLLATVLLAAQVAQVVQPPATEPPLPAAPPAVDVIEPAQTPPPAVPDVPAVEEVPAEGSLDDLAAGAAKDVLNREVGVASAKALSLRDTPGVVSVVSRADIAALGARDLVDLLHLVAGFQFGTDVQGITGVLFRGVWAHEGKVLVLWDGFEINEQMYLTAPIENRFPIRAIDRIEIIRGPGSARYGGYAELAVINIISRGASLKGVDLSGTYGQMQRGFGRAVGEFNIGNTVTEGFLEGMSFAIGAYGGEVARSDQMYNDGYGNAYRMNWENQSTSPTWMNLQLKWGGLSIAALVDAYRVRQRDGFDVVGEKPINSNFYAAHVDVSYRFTAGDWFSLTPRLVAKRQLPWFSGTTFGQYESNAESYFKTADRIRPSLTLELRPLEGLQITSGLESIVDYGRVYASPDGVFGEGLNTLFVDANKPEGSVDVLYWVIAGYLEATLINPIANITAGARFEFHSRTGPSFVPRFAVTKSFGPLWGKLLLSAAYKQPGIENFNANPDVLSENTTVYEAEVGYALSSATTITASLFRIEIQRPIVYGIVDGVETYANFDSTGAQGVELELRMQEEWGTLTANYSFTNSAGLNQVSVYDGPTPGSLRGVAGHKLTGSAGLRLSSNVTLGPSLVVLSERSGWLGAPDGSQGTLVPVVLANLALTYRDLFTEGLDGTVAVYNILDSDYRYIQAFDGGHMPMPTPGRELLLRFAYHFPF